MTREKVLRRASWLAFPCALIVAVVAGDGTYMVAVLGVGLALAVASHMVGAIEDLQRGHTPPPVRCACNCGSEADHRDGTGQMWCWACKFGVHDTCPCSRSATTSEVP